MNVNLNGEATTLPGAMNVSALIDHLELGGKRCAVEINGEIVPRGQHQSRQIAEGDHIEIVHAIGGG